MDMNHKLTDVESIQKFVTGGNAIFTLVSPYTQERYTYKMVSSETEPHSYTIRLLQGDDNSKNKNYHFIGRYYEIVPNQTTIPSVWFIQPLGLVSRNKNECKFMSWIGYQQLSLLVKSNPGRQVAIAWALLDTQAYLDRGCEFWTEGRCAKCGRRLTDPESIKTGFGPYCGGRR